jgi:predicted DCC family thiol-disulfide oxidoreductase YuxK
VAEVTVLYDEGCGFCTRLAARLAGRPEITAAPIGSASGSLMLRDLSPAERYASVHVVDALGRRRSAGGALPPLLRRLPGGRPVAATCEVFPRLTEHAYRLVARNRKLLSSVARLAVCVTPSTSTERQVGSR